MDLQLNVSRTLVGSFPCALPALTVFLSLNLYVCYSLAICLSACNYMHLYVCMWLYLSSYLCVRLSAACFFIQLSFNDSSISIHSFSYIYSFKFIFYDQFSLFHVLLFIILDHSFILSFSFTYLYIFIHSFILYIRSFII